MIEVFKTSVTNESDARMILDQMHSAFPQYKSNFDLDDCDHILRVECVTDFIEPLRLIQFLGSFGFYAEALPETDALDNGIEVESESGLNSYLPV